MFTCKDCLPDSHKWLVDLAMGVSYGPCESCGKTRNCVDYHGTLHEDKKISSDRDIDRYGGA